eukprot:TRINITY_DN5168_c0_g1_i1.p1 TRINITY_DN5168_c0_g1~~TRINITY_DN5168_c0_g1_i1.p1  ORF type:complete len:116 (-),score=33.17 TRINITY_DN5168_c0_g1_i1:203-550(-)
MFSMDSYQKISFWVDELLENEPQCQIYIVGTKCDILEEGEERVRSKEEVQEYVESIGAVGYFETSSKKNVMITELFQAIALNWWNESKDSDTINGGDDGFFGGNFPQTNNSECPC